MLGSAMTGPGRLSGTTSLRGSRASRGSRISRASCGSGARSSGVLPGPNSRGIPIPTRSGSVKSRLRHQIHRPASAKISPSPRAIQKISTGSPMNPIIQLNSPAIESPTTPPQPPTSHSTESLEKKASAVAISTTPIATPRSIRFQSPSGRSSHSRLARIRPAGASKAAGRPSVASSRSAIHAPGRPSRLRAGPPEAVLSDGSCEL
jgi:hypothetical protein